MTSYAFLKKYKRARKKKTDRQKFTKYFAGFYVSKLNWWWWLKSVKNVQKWEFKLPSCLHKFFLTAAVRIDSDCCQNFDKVQHTTVSRIALTEKYAKNLFLLTCFCWCSQGQKKVEKCVTTYSSLTDNVFVDPSYLIPASLKPSKNP